MKITKIEKIDGIYHVTQTSNMFEKIFGIKEPKDIKQMVKYLNISHK